jgi:hypothetical protein
MKNNDSYPFALALGAEHIPVTASVQLQQIIAAQVPGKVSFDGDALTSSEPLQLYTRTADRIEAATRIATGQHLNIQA